MQEIKYFAPPHLSSTSKIKHLCGRSHHADEKEFYQQGNVSPLQYLYIKKPWFRLKKPRLF